MRVQIIKWIQFSAISSLLILTGCVDESGREGRSLIKDFSIASDSTGCGEQVFLYSTGDTCADACTDGTHLATDEEITALAANSTDTIIEIMSNSAGVCADDVVTIERPSEVYVQSDTCACKSLKSASIGNCSTVCAGKTDKTETILYGSVLVGSTIELNDSMVNLHGWCNNEIGDGLTSPKCSLEFTEEGGSVEYVSLTTFEGSNNFQADVTNLDLNKVYVVKVKEVQSGSNAESDAFHLTLKDPDSDDDTTDDPLSSVLNSQYTCVTRAGSTSSDGDDIYTNAARLHFYFNNKNSPPALAAGNPFLFCHDINDHGETDSILFDRLELLSQHFALWDNTDIKFVDQDGDGFPDVDTIIQNKLKDEYDVTDTPRLFWQFSWPNSPEASSATLMGYAMIPWINSDTGRPFCPTRDDYINSTDPILKVLNSVVGNDTEAIYLGKKEPVSLPDDSGNMVTQPDDILIIRQGILEKIWFYYENGQHYTPDVVTSTQKTIHFYWPPDYTNPHTKKPSQKLFTIRSTDELSGTANSGVGSVPTTAAPKDKRIGCVPDLGDPTE
jgi:hypothetical protein